MNNKLLHLLQIHFVNNKIPVEFLQRLKKKVTSVFFGMLSIFFIYFVSFFLLAKIPWQSEELIYLTYSRKIDEIVEEYDRIARENRIQTFKELLLSKEDDERFMKLITEDREVQYRLISLCTKCSDKRIRIYV